MRRHVFLLLLVTATAVEPPAGLSAAASAAPTARERSLIGALFRAELRAEWRERRAYCTYESRGQSLDAQRAAPLDMALTNTVAAALPLLRAVLAEADPDPYRRFNAARGLALLALGERLPAGGSYTLLVRWYPELSPFVP